MSKEYTDRTRGFITSTKLRTFLNCPAQYKQEYMDELDYNDEGVHFILGRAFEDCLRMEKESFERKYSMLTKSQRETIWRGYAEARRNPEFDPFGEYETGKTFHADYIAQNGVKFKLRAELDRYSIDKKKIRDYKFVRDIGKFQWDAEDVYDYPFQMAFYQLVEAIANDHPDELYEVSFDVVDKTKNSVSCSFLVDEYKMGVSRRAVIDALEFLSEAEKLGEFPGQPPDQRLTKCAKCPIYRLCPKAIQVGPVSF